jgi:hypothetical protein
VSDASLVCAKKYVDAAGTASRTQAPSEPNASTLSDVSIKADTLLLD